MKSIISHLRTSSVFVLSLFIVMGILSSPVDAAQAGSYLMVSDSLQITDWSAGTGYSFDMPGQYDSTGPLFYNTGMVEYHGAIVQAKSRADYGSLGVYTYANPGNPNTISTAANAGAMFYDIITIDNPGLNGQQGYLSIWVDVEGEITGTIMHPGVYGGATWSVGLGDYNSSVDQWDYSTNSGRESYHGFLRSNISFTYGQSFAMTVVFSASAGNDGQVADYYNTMTMSLANSRILDGSQNVVDDYTFAAMSGHDYSVPEPATMLLLALGSFVLRRK